MCGISYYYGFSVEQRENLENYAKGLAMKSKKLRHIVPELINNTFWNEIQNKSQCIETIETGFKHGDLNINIEYDKKWPVSKVICSIKYKQDGDIRTFSRDYDHSRAEMSVNKTAIYGSKSAKSMSKRAMYEFVLDFLKEQCKMIIWFMDQEFQGNLICQDSRNKYFTAFLIEQEENLDLVAYDFGHYARNIPDLASKFASNEFWNLPSKNAQCLKPIEKWFRYLCLDVAVECKEIDHFCCFECRITYNGKSMNISRIYDYNTTDYNGFIFDFIAEQCKLVIWFMDQQSKGDLTYQKGP